jgi:hypothetical protein
MALGCQGFAVTLLIGLIFILIARSRSELHFVATHRQGHRRNAESSLMKGFWIAGIEHLLPAISRLGCASVVAPNKPIESV